MRNYGLPDAFMLTFSSARKAAYTQYEADFFGFDPDTFGPTFKTLWGESITASYAIESDEARDDRQRVMTDRVNSLMADGRRMYIDLRYWVNKAFPADQGIRDYFGLDTYSQLSNSQAGMLVQLSDMHRGATHATYGPVLLAAGYTAGKVAALGTLITDLRDENADQDNFIDDSPVATAARETQYNHTWGYMQKVNEASKVAYYGNVKMLNRFTLPATGNTTDVFNVLGTVLSATTGLPISGAKVKLVQLDIVVETDPFGRYAFTEIPAGGHDLEATASGMVPQTVAINVPATGSVEQDFSLSPAP